MVIEKIFASPKRGAAQVECASIQVQAGKGIVGDRNFGKRAHPGQNLTLVEAEEIELFCVRHERALDLSLTRRNLVTRGVRLNDLANVEFSVGPVVLRGVELCEPCSIMGRTLSNESLGSAAVIKHWLHRAGLRVDVLSDGIINIGERIATEA